jgi:hypothetical protein
MKTKAEIEALNPEQRRIATAEICGWERDDICDNWKKDGVVAYCDGRSLHYNQLPDYLGSLDAMHEAEKVLSEPGETQDYYTALDEVAGPYYWNHIHATAEERNCAFLMVMLP